MNLKTGVLAALLTVASQDADAQVSKVPYDETGRLPASEIEFQLPVIKGVPANVVPVDCDMLDENGNITSEFVAAMGVRSHMEFDERRMNQYEEMHNVEISDEQRIEVFLRHLNAHSKTVNLTRERLDAAAQHCRQNYPDHLGNE